MSKAGLPLLRVVAVTVAALLGIVAFARFGVPLLKAAVSFASVSAPSKAATGTVYTVVPGSSACGIKLGASQESVRAVHGWPDASQDYSVAANWRYGLRGEDYTIGVNFATTTKFEGPEAKIHWNEWYVDGIQCFLPSTLGSVRTGVSDRAAVYAAFGEPSDIRFWDTNGRIVRILLLYEKRGFAVTLDRKSELVDGFIIIKE